MQLYISGTRALACAALLTGVLAGCGSGADEPAAKDPGSALTSLSAKEIVLKATKEMQALKSAHIKGDLVDDGEPLSIDLAVDSSGVCAGTISLSGQGQAEIIANGEEQFIRGDLDFWKAAAGSEAAQIIQVLDGRWAKVPTSAQSLADVCDLDKFLSGVDEDKIEGSRMEKGETSTVNGVPAIEIVSTEDDGEGHVWIATEGKPYILELGAPGDSTKNTITFSEFNEPVDASAPEDDDVFDMSSAG